MTPEQRRAAAGVVGLLTIVAFETFAAVTALPVALGELAAPWAYGGAFGLSLAASLVGSVVGGPVVDRRGPAAAGVLGLAAFAAGSLGVGCAPGLVVFGAGRVLQGYGGGLLIVAVYVVAMRTFPAEVRPRVFAAMAAAWVVPSVAGPPLSAAVTALVGWRWLFLPIPLLLAPAAALLRGAAGPARIHRGRREGRAAGLRAACPAVVAAAGGLLASTAPLAGSVPGVVATAGAGVVLLALALPRLLPSGTFVARPGVPAQVLLRGLLAGAFFGAEVVVPLLALGRGSGVLGSGLLVAAGSIGWAAGSWVQGRARVPAARLVVAGCATLAGGLAGVTAAVAWEAPLAAVAGAWCVVGIGMGLGLATVNRHALEVSGPDRQGRTSSALQVADAIAATVLTGLCAALATTGAGGPPAVRLVTAFGCAAGVALLAVVVAGTHARRPAAAVRDGTP